MIKVILEHNDGGSSQRKIPAKEKQLLLDMQKETGNLYKQIKDLKRQLDSLNSDMLIKNQIDEENRIN